MRNRLDSRSQHGNFPVMPTMVSASNVIERRLWTAEDFLRWLEPGLHADLINGEKCMHSPVNLRHASLINFVDGILRLYIERHGLGVLHRETVAVRLGSRNVFLPDLLFLTTEQARGVGPAHVGVAPALVVEALSPTTAGKDIGPKFAAYEEHGVGEYWVLDPETQAHRFYAREGELLVEFANGEEVIRSRQVKGFAMRRQWLGDGAAPKIESALAEIEAGL
jgi:Uma2 family endonuclease